MESNICNLCRAEIILELNGNTTQGEWYSQRHNKACILDGVEDNTESIQRRIEFANKPFVMPEETEKARLANENYDMEHFRPKMYWNE